MQKLVILCWLLMSLVKEMIVGFAKSFSLLLILFLTDFEFF